MPGFRPGRRGVRPAGQAGSTFRALGAVCSATMTVVKEAGRLVSSTCDDRIVLTKKSAGSLEFEQSDRKRALILGTRTFIQHYPTACSFLAKTARSIPPF